MLPPSWTQDCIMTTLTQDTVHLHCPPGAGVNISTHQRMISRLNRVREDNRQLLSDLLKAQTDYHQLLKQSLSEQRLHLHMLSQNLAASSIQPAVEAEDVAGDPSLLS